jgi:hypothetical protein
LNAVEIEEAISQLADQLFDRENFPYAILEAFGKIASRIGVSRWYAGRIREDYRPHPRHWQALAQLVGVRQPNPAKAL